MTIAPKSSGWWQFVLAALLALVTGVAIFASTKTVTDQHEKRITNLEQDVVRKPEMDRVYKQLDRLEDKLDKALEKK